MSYDKIKFSSSGQLNNSQFLVVCRLSYPLHKSPLLLQLNTTYRMQYSFQYDHLLPRLQGKLHLRFLHNTKQLISLCFQQVSTLIDNIQFDNVTQTHLILLTSFSTDPHVYWNACLACQTQVMLNFKMIIIIALPVEITIMNAKNYEALRN